VKQPEKPLRGSAQVEQIPVMWVLPARTESPARLALWLSGGISGMNASGKELDALADAGFAAVSFDSWQRGTRATETMATIFPRAMQNFPNVVWPIIGNSALELLRVLDWAAVEFGIEPPFFVGGHSLGGDIVTAAAGLDDRIGCVATIVATPDWRRPGMHADGKLIGRGQPDSYAQWFYDHMNPLTHLDSYARRPAMTFECGADDDHVPADGALRFREALLAGPYGEACERIRVNLHPGVGHEYTPDMWDHCLAWFQQHAGRP
jgi:dienelactone hydrolase